MSTEIGLRFATHLDLHPTPQLLKHHIVILAYIATSLQHDLVAFEFYLSYHQWICIIKLLRASSENVAHEVAPYSFVTDCTQVWRWVYPDFFEL